MFFHHIWWTIKKAPEWFSEALKVYAGIQRINASIRSAMELSIIPMIPVMWYESGSAAHSESHGNISAQKIAASDPVYEGTESYRTQYGGHYPDIRVPPVCEHV